MQGRRPARCNWLAPPHELELPRGEVHVWRASLDATGTGGAEGFAQLLDCLSREERERGSRYLSAAHGRDFLAARGLLRQLLSRYLRSEPAALQFTYGPHGKPALANAGADWLRFNVSHSGRVVVYVVARDREVGVDVEQLRPELATWQLASAFFAEAEVRALRQFGDKLRPDAFFACWTRKEAYVKATGEGLFVGLDSFEVPVAADPTPDLQTPLSSNGSVWCVRSLDAGNTYAAACAAQGMDWQLRFWHLAPGCGVCSNAA